MASDLLMNSLYVIAGLYLLRRLQVRLRLSKAKHPSLTGHPKMSRLVARWVADYESGEDRFFHSDGAPDSVARKRREGFERLKQHFQTHLARSIQINESMEQGISDVQFVNNYRVPFQYRNYVRSNLKVDTLVEASSGTQIRDIDGNWSYDLTGSYGVNVFGYDFYKSCIEKGAERVRELGPVLGAIDTENPRFHQEALVPLKSETHSSEDVATYADGSGAWLVHGVMEQHVIYYTMREAMAHDLQPARPDAGSTRRHTE